MNISEVDAVEHIVNSLDNEYGSWHDEENKKTWHIVSNRAGVISIVLIDEDDNEEVHSYRLVKE